MTSTTPTTPRRLRPLRRSPPMPVRRVTADWPRAGRGTGDPPAGRPLRGRCGAPGPVTPPTWCDGRRRGRPRAAGRMQSRAACARSGVYVPRQTHDCDAAGARTPAAPVVPRAPRGGWPHAAGVRQGGAGGVRSQGRIALSRARILVALEVALIMGRAFDPTESVVPVDASPVRGLDAADRIGCIECIPFNTIHVSDLVHFVRFH